LAGLNTSEQIKRTLKYPSKWRYLHFKWLGMPTALAGRSVVESAVVQQKKKGKKQKN
jgi:hypothetical protein